MVFDPFPDVSFSDTVYQIRKMGEHVAEIHEYFMTFALSARKHKERQ